MVFFEQGWEKTIICLFGNNLLKRESPTLNLSEYDHPV